MLNARVLIVVFLLSAICTRIPAQSMSFDSGSNPAGGRPKSTQIDLLALLESAGDVFLQMFEKSTQEPTVDSPECNSTASPRETVMTFIEAMGHVAQGRRDALPRALKTFGGYEAEDLEQTAMDLLHVFDRLPRISSGTVPGQDIVKESGIRRYELFPRGIDHRWAYRAISDGARGNIVLIKKDGEWLFDTATLDGVSAMAENMQVVPPRPRREQRGQLFKSVVHPTISGTSFIDWGFLALSTVLGIGIAWGAYKLARWIKAKSRVGGDGFLLPMIDGVLVPIMILAVTFGAAIGTTRLNLHPVLSDFRWSIAEVALVVASAFLLVALLELILLGARRSLFQNDDPYAKMTSLFIRRSLRIVAGIILLLFIFQNVFKWNVTAMLGGFGILALALSLAAQDAVKNLFGAATIFANRPFIGGDWVKFGGELGKVEDVSLQVTRIRLLSGEVLAVPNMKFIDEAVENLSMRKYLRRVMNIAITYDTPAEKVDEALEILHDILTDDAIVSDGRCDLETHPPRVWFDKFGADHLNLRADYWYLMDPEEGQNQRDSERGWFTYLDHATSVNRQVLQRFNASGIDFAFPTQTIELKEQAAAIS